MPGTLKHTRLSSTNPYTAWTGRDSKHAASAWANRHSNWGRHVLGRRLDIQLAKVELPPTPSRGKAVSPHI